MVNSRHHSGKDRVIFAVFLSIIIHVVIVLGVSFNDVPKMGEKSLSNVLDVTLLKIKNNKRDDNPTYLAQADNQGGGSSQHKSSQSSKQTLQSMPQQSKIKTLAETPLENRPKSENRNVPHPSNRSLTTTQSKIDKSIKKSMPPHENKKQKPKTASTPSSVISMPQINQQLDDILTQDEHVYRGDRKRLISASTKQSVAAAYVKAWQMKVERVGNLNYPETARQQGLSGRLVLSVDIRPDGSVPLDGITVLQSSGSKILDNAAIKITRLAAPYAPVSKAVLAGNDLITITRVWRFGIDNQLLTR